MHKSLQEKTTFETLEHKILHLTLVQIAAAQRFYSNVKLSPSVHLQIEIPQSFWTTLYDTSSYIISTGFLLAKPFK